MIVETNDKSKNVNINNVPDYKDGIEVTSLDGFLKIIAGLNADKSSPDAKLYYRGQEVEYWTVEPSIFRNNMLSVEHKLMLQPLRKLPFEFSGLKNELDVFQKYQHYQMCTRLLDITENPMVALYFACQSHGEEKYINDSDCEEYKRHKIDGDEVISRAYDIEPDGIVFFREEDSPVMPESTVVKMILALAKYDLGTENKISAVLDYLCRMNIIDEPTKRKYLMRPGIMSFVEMLQGTCLVLPTVSNERLKNQSGAFLLPGKFNFNIESSNIEAGTVEKARCNLRDEFASAYIYIPGECKQAILEELNNCNINKATLFPELEHQLEYIKEEEKRFTRLVSYFEKFAGFIDNPSIVAEEVAYDLKPLEREMVAKIVSDQIAKVDEIDMIVNIIMEQEKVIDWKTKNSSISKLKMDIARLLLNTEEYKSDAKVLADEIVSKVMIL